MPYIVTTTTPSGAHPGMRCNNPAHATTTRRAVATLDEARDAVHWVWMASSSRRHVEMRIRKSGGKVSLPDGRVIEVRPCTKTALAWDQGMSPRLPVAEIVTAYNAGEVPA